MNVQKARWKIEYRENQLATGICRVMEALRTAKDKYRSNEQNAIASVQKAYGNWRDRQAKHAKRFRRVSSVETTNVVLHYTRAVNHASNFTGLLHLAE